MAVGQTFKSGDKVVEGGIFIFKEYGPGMNAVPPKEAERVVELKPGQVFPRIESTGQICFWVQKR